MPRVRRFAVVTGTSSGVGFALANELLARGWEVAGVSRRAPAIDHSRYQHAQVDLADLSGLTRAFETRFAAMVRDAANQRVALVNNAASAALLGPEETLDPLELSALYAVNTVAPIWCMGFVSRHCPRDAALRVVNVSSGAAVRAFPGLSAYGSAKAALRMAGLVLAAEWASTAPHAPTRTNASIVSYEPGAVDTPMQEAARSHSSERFPWVDMFTGMRDRGVLVSPEQPALEIADLLDADGLPGFLEKRFGV